MSDGVGRKLQGREYATNHSNKCKINFEEGFKKYLWWKWSIIIVQKQYAKGGEGVEIKLWSHKWTSHGAFCNKFSKVYRNYSQQDYRVSKMGKWIG